MPVGATAVADTGRRRRDRAWPRGLPAAAWAIPAGLFGFGLALRLPYLWTIPTLSDEANEVLRGLDVAQGRILPLTNVNTYLGSLYNYLLAGVFLVVGPDPFVARLLMALAGALTVVVTYTLLRELGATRPISVVGAGLLATSGAHILVSSHIAWAHCLTPLASTVGLWLLARAVQRDRARLLVGAGLALGLAVQTHTSAVALLPGPALYVLARRPSWLRAPWPYLAAALFLLVNANLIAFAVMTRGESFAEAGEHVRSYARSGATGAELYVENLGKLGLTLVRMTAGAIDVRESAVSYLADPTVWAYVALLLVGLIWGAARGSALPLLVVVPYVLALPLVNSKFEVVPNGRFLAPLLPILYAAVAIGLGAAWALARERPAVARPAVARPAVARPAVARPADARLPVARQAVARQAVARQAVARQAVARRSWVAILAAGLVVLWPLFPLAARYSQMADSERASRELLDAVAAIDARRAPDEAVALDPDLDKLWLDGGGDYLVAFRYHLTMRAIPNQELEVRRRSEQGNVDSCDPSRVELRRVEPARTPLATRLHADDPVTPVDESERPYWLVRTVQRADRARDAQRGQADERSATIATYTPPLFGASRAVDRCAPRRPI